MRLKVEFIPSRKQSTEGSVPRHIEFLRTKTQFIPQSYKNKVSSHSHSVRLGVIPPPSPTGGDLANMLLSSESDNSNHGPRGVQSNEYGLCLKTRIHVNYT